ncbi:MAG: HAMP domain-containing sensor histidine kinase [Actinomycetota bacterium]
MTLRLRLTVFIALVVAVAVAAVSWFSYASTAGEARADIDAFLQERARFADRIGDRDGVPFDPSEIPTEPGEQGPFGGFARYDTIVHVVAADGTVIPLFGEAALPVEAETIASALAGDATVQDVTVEGTHYRMITTPGPAGMVVQTARDLTETDRLLASLRLRLLLMGAGGVMLAAVGAWFVAGRALAPVGRLTDAAEHVAQTGHLDAPIPEAGNDEVGRLAGAFNGMLAALAISRRQQRSLVDDAGHELRTPLTSLRTNLDVLARNPDMEAGVRAELMADVSYEIEQLSNLVSEVVELAGGSEAAGQPPIASDLGEIVRAAAARAARRTGRTIEVSGTGGTAEVRPARIARAVANLLDNATKWSPPDEPIDVVLEAGRIEVRDRGPGIPSADLARVFDRFYRAEAARTMPGSGLGLAIVEQIAREHGGSVWAMPREGGGTSVGFEVPLVEVSP